MNEEKNLPYYIGLDMGTSSVGWAVTDQEYNVCRGKGKDMWGTRLFEEAKTAEERRSHRTSRRRLRRQKVRNAYLTSCFADEIEKVDSGFLVRLQDSKFHLIDKTDTSCKYALFNDPGYTDRDYYNEFPTVFHLIEKLKENDINPNTNKPYDIRLYYLACLNIFNRRGHFLDAGSKEDNEINFDINEEIKNVYEDIRNFNFNDEDEILENKLPELNDQELKELIKLFKNSYKYSIKKNKFELSKILKFVDKKGKAVELNKFKISDFKKAQEACDGKKFDGKLIDRITLIFDSNVNLFNNFKEFFDEVPSDPKDIKITFNDAEFDEKLEGLALPQKLNELILLYKKMRDLRKILIVLGDSKSLSGSRVADYEKHSSQLKQLKSIYKAYDGQKLTYKNKEYKIDFYNMFEEAGVKDNYAGYINSTIDRKYNKKNDLACDHRCRRNNKFNRDSFFKRLQNELMAIYSCCDTNVTDDISKDELSELIEGTGKHFKVNDDSNGTRLDELDSENFEITLLPKQIHRGSDNGTIPYQLHYTELAAVLNKCAINYPFLEEEINDEGLSLKDSILQMFKWCIPYWCGPLKRSTDEDEFSWMKTNDEIGLYNNRIYPWNFDKVVDCKKTHEDFIKRMVRYCTYIKDEKVLPKDSLIYEEYLVLNELNNLKINLEPISVGLKKDIYNDLFLSGDRVTVKKLLAYLKKKDPSYKDLTEDNLKGFDVQKGAFENKLVNQKRWKRIFGVGLNNPLNDEQTKIAEDLIYQRLTNSDKKEFKKYIRENYSSVLNEEQIKKISKLPIKDWGRLSKELLTLPDANNVDDNGEATNSVISLLWSTNQNLMQILYNANYSFKEYLQNEFTLDNSNIEDITFEYFDDLYLSAPVKRMAWQTIKIVKEIVEVKDYKPAKIFIEMTRSNETKGDDERSKSRKNHLSECYKNIKDSERDWKNEIDKREEGEFSRKKLFLYYTQKGKCMYTGEEISINELFTTNYDIDHIYPRSLVKDDSINNNLVLVKKSVNQNKTNEYPIKDSIRTKMGPFWAELVKNNLITAEKYQRLVRNTPLTTEEISKFIERQLVETSQGTKAVADVLKSTLPNARIVYVKANMVSDFRHAPLSGKVDPIAKTFPDFKLYENCVDENLYKNNVREWHKNHIKKKRAYEFLKCRELNDLHHAYDAYLNIVVGNVYDTKFTKNPRNFIKESKNKNGNYDFNLSRMFDYTVKRGDEVAWIVEPNGDSYNFVTLDNVARTLCKNTPIVTKMPIEQTGQLYDETLHGTEDVKKECYIPFNENISCMQGLEGMRKYGGFTKVKNAYMFVAEKTNEKGERVSDIGYVPIIDANKIARLKSQDEKDRYLICLAEKQGMKEPKILNERVLFNVSVNIDGFPYYIHKKGYCLNASQFKICRDKNKSIAHDFESEFSDYLRILVKFESDIKEKTKKSKSKVKLESENFIFNTFTAEEKKDYDEKYLKWLNNYSNSAYNCWRVNKIDNMKAFDMLLFKMQGPNCFDENKWFYSKSKMARKKNSFDSVCKPEIQLRFEELDIYQQAYTLIQIHDLFKRPSGGVDLRYLLSDYENKKIKGTNIGTLRLGKFDDMNYFSIKHQSVTGLYEWEEVIINKK